VSALKEELDGQALITGASGLFGGRRCATRFSTWGSSAPPSCQRTLEPAASHCSSRLGRPWRGPRSGLGARSSRGAAPVLDRRAVHGSHAPDVDRDPLSIGCRGASARPTGAGPRRSGLARL